MSPPWKKVPVEQIDQRKGVGLAFDWHPQIQLVRETGRIVVLVYKLTIIVPFLHYVGALINAQVSSPADSRRGGSQPGGDEAASASVRCPSSATCR